MTTEQKRSIMFVYNMYREKLDEMLFIWREKCKSGNFEAGADKSLEAIIKNFDEVAKQLEKEIKNESMKKEDY